MRPFAYGCLAIAALSSLASAVPSRVSAEELVTFGSKPGLQGYLTRPKGEGPFPAVVLLHSCLGLPANRLAIAAEVARWGYVALFVDDFATRGIRQTCAVDFAEGVSDAFGALLYISKLPKVDPARIAAVGYSQGADTALALATSHEAFSASDQPKFKAVAAFYPPCANRDLAQLEIPTLILIGKSDEVTPAVDCERLARNQQAGSYVKLVVYPGAAHGFDNPGFANGVSLFGMRLQYNQSAAEQSVTALRDFLAAKLAR